MSAGTALVTASLAFTLLTADLPVILRCLRLGAPLASLALSEIKR
jgi:hypothetical protein